MVIFNRFFCMFTEGKLDLVPYIAKPGVFAKNPTG
jgi:hypothetical protein